MVEEKDLVAKYRMNGEEAQRAGVKHVTEGAWGYDEGTTYYLVADVERLKGKVEKIREEAEKIRQERKKRKREEEAEYERNRQERVKNGLPEYEENLDDWDDMTDSRGAADFGAMYERRVERQRNPTDEDAMYELYQDHLNDIAW